MVVGNAERFPDLDGFVVVLENGEIQLFLGKPEVIGIGGKIIGPGAHLFFEILAEAEVAEHLEEGLMATRGADDLDVVGAHALLSGGCADIGVVKLFLMQEVGLELNHARARQEQGRVVGDQR